MYRGLYHLRAGVVFSKTGSTKNLQFGQVKTLLVDLGCAITTIGGYDAKRLGIKHKQLKSSGYSRVGGHVLRTYKMKYVMFVFRHIDGTSRYEFLPEVDVLSAEEGMTEEDHIPSLLGIDVLRTYTLKPRLTRCYLEK